MSHKLSTKEDIEELSMIRYIQSFSPYPAGETPGTMHLRSLSTGTLGRSGLRTCRTSEALADEIDDYLDYDNNSDTSGTKKDDLCSNRDHLLSQLLLYFFCVI